MIRVHRLTGEALYLNADLVEAVEATPDTMIGLVDGRKIVVRETPETVVSLVREFRASLLVTADELRTQNATPGTLSIVHDDDGGVDVLFVVGLVAALLGIVIAMVLDGNALRPLLSPSSFVLVSTATVGAAVMSYRGNELKLMPRAALHAVTGTTPDMQAMINELGRLSEIARRSGMLALDDEIEHIDDRVVRLGVQMIVDGIDEDVLRDTMSIEIAATDERHRTAISFFKLLSQYAPTFGMVGTLIGLVNMLANLSDPSALGSGLAMALLTTFYGVLLANLVFNPIATRLSRLNEVELGALDVAMDGIVTMRNGAGPRRVIERLESYLPPGQRIGVSERLALARTERPAATTDAAA